jgi:hypothetical protein
MASRATTAPAAHLTPTASSGAVTVKSTHGVAADS